MNFTTPQTLADIANVLSCTYIGDPSMQVFGINEIHKVRAGDIVFVDHPKYYEKALQSKATVIIIDKKVDCPPEKGLLVSLNPFGDFNKITQHFSSPKSHISQAIQNYPGVHIGNHVQIGKNVVLHPGVCIMDHTIIEDDVTIGPNSVIGHSAFYYKKRGDSYEAMHSCGYVHIEKKVEIGASCTIDCGVTDVTRIGAGSKLDNHIQIGHDTSIGKNCLIAAQTGIAGCVTIGDQVVIWGQVGIASGISIGNGCTVLAQSGVAKDLEGNKTYFGSPCGEAKEKFKEIVALRMLPTFLSKNS